MSTFTVTIEVSDLQAVRWQAVDVLVDMGTTYTKVPRGVLRGLGIVPRDMSRARIANGQVIQSEIGHAMIRLQSREHPNPVTFGEAGEDPLLGSITLESFSLAVDPVNRRLVPVEALEMGEGPVQYEWGSGDTPGKGRGDSSVRPPLPAAIRAPSE